MEMLSEHTLEGWYEGYLLSGLHCFFFFQAEDGIRDADVTGVQTCALPICQEAAKASLADTPAEDEASEQYAGAFRREHQRGAERRREPAPARAAQERREVVARDGRGSGGGCQHWPPSAGQERP